MIAAIYARKSTEQTGTSEDARSVARQIEHAKSFAESKGWSPSDAYVFVDDGISGAEFEARAGFTRLMAALKPRPRFDVLVMSEESRLGREAIRTMAALQQIVQAGVRVWFYLENRELTLGSMADNTMTFLRAEFAAEERRKAAQRTYDAMARKARAGHVTGGRVFGYDNVRIHGSHVERHINPEEAAVVLDIYERFARGQGLRRIAHELNARRAPCPRAQRGRPAGFEIGTVRAILERTLYRGIVTWNQSRKRNKWGVVEQRDRPETDWMRIEAPSLRIVPDDLAAVCDARREERRDNYLLGMDGKQLGRPATSSGKYLLSGGLLRCPCGANFEAIVRPNGRTVGNVYGCAARRRKGRAVCDNGTLLDIGMADAAVLDVLIRAALDPRLVEDALDSLVTAETCDRDGLEAERADLTARISNLTTAIGMGGDIPALVDSLRQAEARLRAVERDLAPREEPDRATLRAAMTTQLGEWKAILSAHAPQTKAILRSLIEPILVDPAIVPSDDDVVPDYIDPLDRSGKENIEPGDYIDWIAAVRPESLANGLLHKLASPAGVEPASPP